LWLHYQADGMDSCRAWHSRANEPISGQSAGTGSSPATTGSLADLPQGARATIAAIAAHGSATLAIGDVAHSTIARRLIELGFVPGEQVEIIRKVWPGGDPMAVRVGSSVFALRRREAQAVLVDTAPPGEP
jgi:ferrous iron transport protein A